MKRALAWKLRPLAAAVSRIGIDSGARKWSGHGGDRRAEQAAQAMQAQRGAGQFQLIQRTAVAAQDPAVAAHHDDALQQRVPMNSGRRWKCRRRRLP